MFMRIASPNERHTISREDLSFYNALVIAAAYEVDKHTEKPAYEGVSSITFDNHISIIYDNGISSDVEASETLIAVYLPKFLAEIVGLRAAASTVDAHTWTGSRMFFEQASEQQSEAPGDQGSTVTKGVADVEKT
ncbi:hypothetical protein EYZ11_010610 [Aspergillus tanneri]|uniref:Uncharacterized protein n=1 Tax=Aspergillus tanneri TaxID=1220188 RepID=A0A4S3J719_9EURO|nr:hypothetical protein EYZ11_010610 [Aspergillus tanneri]